VQENTNRNKHWTERRWMTPLLNALTTPQVHLNPICYYGPGYSNLLKTALELN